MRVQKGTVVEEREESVAVGAEIGAERMKIEE